MSLSFLFCNRQINGLALVVVTCLKEVDSIVADQVHEPMLLREATRPSPCEEIFQRFWLTDSVKGISHDRIHQIQRSRRNSAVALNPEQQILTELWMKDGIALSSRTSRPFSPGAEITVGCS